MPQPPANEAHIREILHSIKLFQGRSIDEIEKLRTVKVDPDGSVKIAIEAGLDNATRQRFEHIAEWEIRKTPEIREVVFYQAATPQQGQQPPAAPTPPPEDRPIGQGPGAHRQAKPPAPRPDRIPGVKHVIAVASGKGGVGKSTVATNLAVALSHAGNRVGLMDADIYGPSIPMMLGAEGQLMQAPSGQIRPLERYNLKLMSIGFAVDEGTPVIWRGLMVMKMLKNFLMNVMWGELDYLVIDLPPGTGDAQLTLVQTVEVDGAVIVTTPQDVSLADVRKAYEMFRTVRVPVLGIVENMSGFVCPNCGHEEHIFRKGGGPRFAQEEGVKLLGHIPLNSAICEGGDQGVPVAYKLPDSVEANAFKAVAASVTEALAVQTA